MLSAFVGVPEVNRVYNVDALTLLRAMPDKSVGLIAVDPPYNGVKDEAWDNQWATDADFLEWLRAHLIEFRRVLKPNGSLYLFASPRMAARVEVLTGEYFNVLNNIRWVKDAGWHMKTSKEEIRGYLEPWEAAIFAEQYGASSITPIGDFIRQTRIAAGFKGTDIDVALGYVRTKDPTRGTELCRRWEEGSSIPSEKDFINVMRVCGAKANYEVLHQQYEELRRPFCVSQDVAHTDTWGFSTVTPYAGKHPCEKPAAMMQHIVNASSRAGDLVLDCFCGSGQTLAAAHHLGRDYIGCDIGLNWVEVARNRCVKDFGARRRNAVTVLDDLPLFAARPA